MLDITLHKFEIKLMKSNVRNVRPEHFNTTQRKEHFFISFLKTKQINNFDCQCNKKVFAITF